MNSVGVVICMYMYVCTELNALLVVSHQSEIHRRFHRRCDVRLCLLAVLAWVCNQPGTVIVTNWERFSPQQKKNQ